MGLLILYASLKALPKLLHAIWILLLIGFASAYFLTSIQLAQPTNAKVRKAFCTYSYEVKDGTIPLCSTFPLTKEQISLIDNRAKNSLILYKTFASKKYHKSVEFDIPLTIYIMDVKTLNDKSKFGNKFTKRVVGRYSDGLGNVYITAEIFAKIGYTDLQHELAHYGNDNLGLFFKKDALNEKVANQFEQYYRRHVR